MYRYETHLHTYPVSKCAKAGVRETVQFYQKLGYDGIFVTNHFLDGNINIDKSLPYEEKLRFYFSDYDQAVEIGKELGIKVFLGVELSYGGTDFLIYGLDKDWYFAHPEIMEMSKSQELNFLMEQGALVIQAHPLREAGYIDHIRLYPRSVHGVEVLNSSMKDEVNAMAELYRQSYGLLSFAGSDNHTGLLRKKLAGMDSETPIESEWEFVQKVKAGEMHMFTLENPYAE